MLSGDAGFSSATSEEKNAVEEVDGRRLWDFTIGFRAIILVLSCRMERTWDLEMWAGMRVIARVSVEVLRTGDVSCRSIRGERDRGLLT
jgi:hypothetical protein